MTAMRLSGDCPLCRKHLVRRTRKVDGGAFLSCSGFPKCKFSESIDPHISSLSEEIRVLRIEVRTLQSRADRKYDVDKELKELIFFAHPDKWPNSQDLSHGITVRINALRGRI